MNILDPFQLQQPKEAISTCKESPCCTTITNFKNAAGAGIMDSGSFPVNWNHHSSYRTTKTAPNSQADLCFYFILCNNGLSHGRAPCELAWNTDISLQATIKALMLGTSAMLPWFPASVRASPSHASMAIWQPRMNPQSMMCADVSSTSVSVPPAGLVNELLQPSFDLVVGEESHVPRVSHSQAVPVSQQGRPGLHKHTERLTL